MIKKIVLSLVILVVLAGIALLIQQKEPALTERLLERSTALDRYNSTSGKLVHEGYAGLVVLTGTYFTDDRVELIELFFEPDAQSKAKLPQYDGRITFSNATEAAHAFGIPERCLSIVPQREVADGCLVEGKATIEVNNFHRYVVASDGSSHLTLERVISADSPRNR